MLKKKNDDVFDLIDDLYCQLDIIQEKMENNNKVGYDILKLNRIFKDFNDKVDADWIKNQLGPL